MKFISVNIYVLIYMGIYSLLGFNHNTVENCISLVNHKPNQSHIRCKEGLGGWEKTTKLINLNTYIYLCNICETRVAKRTYTHTHTHKCAT